MILFVNEKGEVKKMKNKMLKYLNDNKDECLEIVKKNGLDLKLLHCEMQADKEVVLAAVKQNGLALKHATYDLQEDEDVIKTALEQNDKAIKFVGEDYKNAIKKLSKKTSR